MIAWDVDEKDFDVLKSWGHLDNPFKAIEDFSELKLEYRWLNQEHREAYLKYYLARMSYVKDKDFDKYYKTEDKPIDFNRWNFLKQRKAWWNMPLGWDEMALNGSKVIDMGCGDGDTVQRFIDHVAQFWLKHNIKDRKMHVIGVDLNYSRIDNARKYVQSPDPKITFEFFQADVIADGLDYQEKSIDFSLCTGVFEILDDSQFDTFLNEMCRITDKGIYITDLFEKYPGGYPRQNLADHLQSRGYCVDKKVTVLSEPFIIDKLSCPKRLWSIFPDQNIFAKKVVSV